MSTSKNISISWEVVGEEGNVITDETFVLEGWSNDFRSNVTPRNEDSPEKSKRLHDIRKSDKDRIAEVQTNSRFKIQRLLW